MTDKLEGIFTGTVPPGVYRSTLRPSAGTIARHAERHGWRVFRLDGRKIASKADFLAACADAMDFPAYFGRNWDALEESARDLAWTPAGGYLVLYDDAARFAAAQPEEFAVALEILHSAVAHWRGTPTPMAVLLRGAGRGATKVPRL
jgi:hypothetical protein